MAADVPHSPEAAFAPRATPPLWAFWSQMCNATVSMESQFHETPESTSKLLPKAKSKKGPVSPVSRGRTVRCIVELLDAWNRTGKRQDVIFFINFLACARLDQFPKQKKLIGKPTQPFQGPTASLLSLATPHTRVSSWTSRLFPLLPPAACDLRPATLPPTQHDTLWRPPNATSRATRRSHHPGTKYTRTIDCKDTASLHLSNWETAQLCRA